LVDPSGYAPILGRDSAVEHDDRHMGDVYVVSASWRRRRRHVGQATQPSRFYDVETGDPVRVQLEQVGAEFRILRQFAYQDPRYEDAFVVPANLRTFTTDLASIPALFSWLVPGIGNHLPAILLHDALVINPGDSATHEGPSVDREEADRILRDSMASLGTPKLRRWLIWTAVIVVTAWSTLQPRLRWRALVVTTIAGVAALGVLATLDVVDVWDTLPWMSDRSWAAELLGGAAFALLIPVALSALWGRLWSAGVIAGVALAFLLHITAVLFVLYGTYWLAETVVSHREGASPNPKRNLQNAAAPD
jgi:hypothetical protein